MITSSSLVVLLAPQHPPSFTKVEVFWSASSSSNLHLEIVVACGSFPLLNKYAKSRWNSSSGSGNFQPVFATSIDDKYTRLSRHSTWMLQLIVTARCPILTAVSVFNTQVPRMYPFYDHSLSCRNDQSNFLCDFAELNFLCGSLAIQTFQFSFAMPNASNQLSVIVLATDFQILTVQDIALH